MSALRKNVAAQVVTFNLVNASTGAALTGATVTTKVALDGTQSAGAGSVTELGTGQYKYEPTQGETNGASVGFSFTASGAVPVNLHCFTIGQDPTVATWQVDVAKWLGSVAGAQVVAGDAMTLTSGERSALAAAILDLSNAIETGVTLRGAQRLMLAALAGKLSGAAGTTVTFRNAVADSKDRITAVVDGAGDRTAISYDQT